MLRRNGEARRHHIHIGRHQDDNSLAALRSRPSMGAGIFLATISSCLSSSWRRGMHFLANGWHGACDYF